MPLVEIDIPTFQFDPSSAAFAYFVGDMTYEDAVPRGQYLDVNPLMIGNPNTKSVPDRHSVIMWDKAAIPKGVVFTRAKLTVKAATTNSFVTLTIDLEALQANDELDSISREDLVRVTRRRLTCVVNDSQGVGGLSSDNISAQVDTADITFFDSDVGHQGAGFATNVSQAMTINASGKLDAAAFRLKRNSQSAGTGPMYARIWSAQGAPGNYRKKNLLSTGESNPVDLSTLTGTQQYIIFDTSPDYASAPQVEPGDIIIAELVAEPAGDASASSLFMVGMASTDALTTNATFYAIPGLKAKGFYHPHFYSGKDIHEAPKIPGSSTIAFPTPIFSTVASTVYALGDAAYSPDVTLAGFTQLVQDAFDQESDFIALRFTSTSGVINHNRQFYGSRSGVNTVPGLGNGIVLTLEYDADTICIDSTILDPAVDIRKAELIAAVAMDADLAGAVESQSVGVSAAVSQDVQLDGAVSTDVVVEAC